MDAEFLASYTISDEHALQTVDHNHRSVRTVTCPGSSVPVLLSLLFSGRSQIQLKPRHGVDWSTAAARHERLRSCGIVLFTQRADKMCSFSTCTYKYILLTFIHLIALIAIRCVYSLRLRAFLPLKIRQRLTLTESKTKTRSLESPYPTETNRTMATTRTKGRTDCNRCM